jgi:two-component system, LuxR family, response regulator FixJ
MMTSSVCIVDDELEMCRSLQRLLKSEGIVADYFLSAEEFLAGARLDDVAVLILDLRLSGISGIELQDELRRRQVDVVVVVMSGHATTREAIRTFRAGAVDVLEKPFHDDALIDCVKSHLDDQIARQARRNEAKRRLAALSAREREVLCALLEGKTTTRIARELQISASTVEKHRLQIFEKMQVSSTVELVLYCTRANVSDQAQSAIWFRTDAAQGPPRLPESAGSGRAPSRAR